MSAKKEKLHIVLVGCGRIATLHVLGYENNPDAELYGVCDKDIKKAEQFAKTYGVEKVYKSYEEVLIDKAVDAVEILVPHHLHCEMTVKGVAKRGNTIGTKAYCMNRLSAMR